MKTLLSNRLFPRVAGIFIVTVFVSLPQALFAHEEISSARCSIENKHTSDNNPLACWAFRPESDPLKDLFDCCWTANAYSPIEPPLSDKIVSVHGDGQM